MEPPTDPVHQAWRANAVRFAHWLLTNLAIRVDRYGFHKPKSRAISDGPLTPDVALAHAHGRRRADIIGSLTVAEQGGTCYTKELGIDIDAHDATPEQRLANEAAAIAWYDILVSLGYDPLLTSEVPGGYHLRALHQQPQEARLVQALGRWLGSAKK